MSLREVDVELGDASFEGAPVVDLIDAFLTRGYVPYATATDVDVVLETPNTCNCARAKVAPFARGCVCLGFRRNAHSYRAFGVCSECYRVVFEL